MIKLLPVVSLVLLTSLILDSMAPAQAAAAPHCETGTLVNSGTPGSLVIVWSVPDPLEAAAARTFRVYRWTFSTTHHDWPIIIVTDPQLRRCAITGLDLGAWRLQLIVFDELGERIAFSNIAGKVIGSGKIDPVPLPSRLPSPVLTIEPDP